MTLAEKAEQGTIPVGMVIEDEAALRQERLAQMAKAKAVLEARAKVRYDLEKAEYKAKLREREATEKAKGRKLGGRKPKPPTPGPRDKDQYNFTDPDSPIMKNSNNQGFDQHYNAQVAVEQSSILIVSHTLSNHPNDKQEAVPTLEAVPTEQIGSPKRLRWTMAIVVRPTLQPSRPEGLNLTLPPDVKAIIKAGKSSLPGNLTHRHKMPVRRKKWPAN